MKKMLIAVAAVTSLAALAAPPQQPPPQAQGQGQGWGQAWQGQGGPMVQPDSPEARQRREQSRRMMQVVGLTEALGLSTQEALRVDEVIRRFDERRRPLKEQVRESGRVVMEAARGDAAALAQVDQAIGRVLDARVQLASLDKEMFGALAQGLNPQQRARLALFYARFHKGKAARMMRGGGAGFDGDGNEGRRMFRMRRMMRPGAPFGEADAPPSGMGEVAAGQDPGDGFSDE